MSKVQRDTFMTYTGKVVPLLAPKSEHVCFEDIARALSRVQRFGGHSFYPYSVAEHSVLVSRLCMPQHAILGLMHDASEAYAGDVVTPLKKNLPGYREIEERWMLAIGQACGLGDALGHLPADIKAADTIALQTERRDLFNDDRVDPEGPDPSPAWGCVAYGDLDAYHAFVERFVELTGVRP